MHQTKKLAVSFGSFACVVEGYDHPFPIMLRVVKHFRDIADKDPSFGQFDQIEDVAALQALLSDIDGTPIEVEPIAGGVYVRKLEHPQSAAVDLLPDAADAPSKTVEEEVPVEVDLEPVHAEDPIKFAPTDDIELDALVAEFAEHEPAEAALTSDDMPVAEAEVVAAPDEHSALDQDLVSTIETEEVPVVEAEAAPAVVEPLEAVEAPQDPVEVEVAEAELPQVPIEMPLEDAPAAELPGAPVAEAPVSEQVEADHTLVTAEPETKAEETPEAPAPVVAEAAPTETRQDPKPQEAEPEADVPVRAQVPAEPIVDPVPHAAAEPTSATVEDTEDVTPNQPEPIPAAAEVPSQPTPEPARALGEGIAEPEADAEPPQDRVTEAPAVVEPEPTAPQQPAEDSPETTPIAAEIDSQIAAALNRADVLELRRSAAQEAEDTFTKKTPEPLRLGPGLAKPADTAATVDADAPRESFVDRVASQPDTKVLFRLDDSKPQAHPRAAEPVSQTPPPTETPAANQADGTEPAAPSPRRGFDALGVGKLLKRKTGADTPDDQQVKAEKPSAPPVAPKPEPTPAPVETASAQPSRLRVIHSEEPTVESAQAKPQEQQPAARGGLRGLLPGKTDTPTTEPAGAAAPPTKPKKTERGKKVEGPSMSERLNASFAQASTDPAGAATFDLSGDGSPEDDYSARGFARRLGASSLPDLMGAAAAFLVLVEGRETISRNDIMELVKDLAGDTPLTAEAKIKAFGKLVRSGDLVRSEGGQFGMSSDAIARMRAKFPDEDESEEAV